MIKFTLKLTPDQVNQLNSYQRQPEYALEHVILSRRGEVEAEQHLIDIGFAEPTLEHFMWKKWIERIEARNNE